MNNSITQKEIDHLVGNAEVEVLELFDKTTIVSVKLENGFVLTESSSCVDPVNYSKEIGIKICLERIKNRLWELEGYSLQKQLKKDD